jgi:hypothetical protein
MRTFFVGSILAAGVFAPVSAFADLLHDNFPPDATHPLGTYNETKFLSSEFNTQVEDTWVVDDAKFLTEFPVIIQELEWVGIRQTKVGSLNLTYTNAGYSIRTRTGSPGSFDFPLVAPNAQGAVNYTAQVLASLPNNMELYLGKLTLSDPIQLDPGEDFWFGIRLIGDASNFNLGRNFMVSAINQIGVDEGFHFNGWLPASAFPGFAGQKTDFAFRVYGVEIPEPSTLAVLLLGTLVLGTRLRRR